MMRKRERDLAQAVLNFEWHKVSPRAHKNIFRSFPLCNILQS